MKNEVINVVCPKCGAELKVENVAVKSARGRIEQLRAAGVDVSGMFAMNGDGGEFVVAQRNGSLQILEDDDPIFQYIVTAGDVPNRNLFRRWVMAQMFRMLTDKDYETNKPIGFSEALRRKGYEYSWRVLVNELHAQNEMWKHGDEDSYLERHIFFDSSVAYRMAGGYISDLVRFLDSKPRKRCKFRPYIHIQNRDVFVDELETEFIDPLRKIMIQISAANNPTELYNAVVRFDKARKKLNWRTPMSPFFVDAFKGAGAYFTMQNLVRFHGCFIYGDDDSRLYKEFAVGHLREFASQCMDGECGYKILGLLKQVLKDNGINIEEKIKSWRKA